MFKELFERHSERDERTLDMNIWKDDYKLWKRKRISDAEFAMVSYMKEFKFLYPFISSLWAAGTKENFDGVYNKIPSAHKTN